MTELEKAVAKALRLSDSAAELLLVEIQQNIETAKAELIRSGVSESVVDTEGPLIVDAIKRYCQATMGDEGEFEKYMNSFMYQQENLRKS